MVEEYYIRSLDSETARGPYTIEKLVTLGESGQVTIETLYYDDQLESWITIGSNPELREKVFPKRKSLSLRKKRPEEIEQLNRPEEAPPVQVTEMLAAAEGSTEETRFVKERELWASRTAALSLPALGIILIASAASLGYPSIDIVQNALAQDTGALMQILQTPLVLFALFDLVAGFLCLLAASEIFPLLRFRALFGAGFLGFTYTVRFLNGDENSLFLAISAVLLGIGLFVATLTLSFRLMVAALVLCVAGVVGFFYFANLLPLIGGD